MQLAVRYPDRLRRAAAAASTAWREHAANCEYCDRHHRVSQCATGIPLWREAQKLAKQLRLLR